MPDESPLKRLEPHLRNVSVRRFFHTATAYRPWPLWSWKIEGVVRRTGERLSIQPLCTVEMVEGVDSAVLEAYVLWKAVEGILCGLELKAFPDAQH